MSEETRPTQQETIIKSLDGLQNIRPLIVTSDIRPVQETPAVLPAATAEASPSTAAQASDSE